jgi:hypothetical protein
MNELLQSLDKMKDMQIVRFFSQFFTEEKVSPLLGQVKSRIAGGTGGNLVHELILWAVFLAVGTFIIDQVFYWTSPGQIEEAKNTWKNFTAGVANLGTSARILVERARGIGRTRLELPNGRR